MPTTQDGVFEERIEKIEQAIDEHGMSIYHFFYSRTQNTQDAEDLMQELWIHVLQRFDDEQINQLGLLLRKAKQIFVDFSRRSKNNPVSAVETLPDTKVDTGLTHDPCNEEDEHTYMTRFFREYGLDSLAPQKQQAVWLYARYGMTYKEIGTKLNKSANTIGDWIREVRKTFSNQF